MNEMLIFFAEHGWARWTVFVLFMLLIARKPTLRYFQWRMEKKASELEVSSYEILRKEIATLNRLLVEEQKEKRILYEKIEALEITISELRMTVASLNRLE